MWYARGEGSSKGHIWNAINLKSEAVLLNYRAILKCVTTNAHIGYLISHEGRDNDNRGAQAAITQLLEDSRGTQRYIARERSPSFQTRYGYKNSRILVTHTERPLSDPA